jgi:hypothetical protein
LKLGGVNPGSLKSTFISSGLGAASFRNDGIKKPAENPLTEWQWGVLSQRADQLGKSKDHRAHLS